MTFDKKGYPVDKKFNDVRNEFKLISCEDRVWTMWEDVFDKFEGGELVCPFQGIPYNQIENSYPFYVSVRSFLGERECPEISDTEVK
jgi:hypothetical protein